MAGEPKSASAWSTARMKPLMIAGSASGNVIVSATRRRLAPRIAPASSRSEAISSSVLTIMM